MNKSMHEMDEQELGLFISQQEHKVAKLDYERRDSSEHSTEAGILKDARQLLADKRKEPHTS